MSVNSASVTPASRMPATSVSMDRRVRATLSGFTPADTMSGPRPNVGLEAAQRVVRHSLSLTPCRSRMLSPRRPPRPNCPSTVFITQLLAYRGIGSRDGDKAIRDVGLHLPCQRQDAPSGSGRLVPVAGQQPPRRRSPTIPPGPAPLSRPPLRSRRPRRWRATRRSA